MPNYKLIYFDVRGRGEAIRLMFALAEIQYEDKRITLDEWKAMETKPGLGLLPILMVDDKELQESGAIYRYIGSLHGFYPTDAWDRARVDVVLGIVEDFFPGIEKIFEAPDEAKKKELIQKYATEVSVPHLRNLEKVLKQNNEGLGWFVGDKITIADVQAFVMLHDFLPHFTGKADGEPADLSKPLQEFVDRFKSEPKVAAWLTKRPHSQF